MKNIFCTVALAIGGSMFSQAPSSTFSTMSGMQTSTELFDDISFGGYDLISANLKYSKDNSLQKVVFSPFKLIPDANYFSDVRINLTQKDDISTFGLSFGFDNTNPYNKISDRVATKFRQMPSRPPLRPKNDEETEAAYKAYVDAYEVQGNNDRINYFKSLAKNAFSASVGFNVSYFGILGGDEVKDDSGVVTNKYAVKGYSISLDFSYSINHDWLFAGGFSYQNKRKTAAEKQELINYYGCNAAVSYRAFYLQSDSTLSSNKDYIKSFFIPSILTGISLEYLKADGNQLFFENDIRKQFILMPFLDVKISPTNQFRIGVPVKKYDSVNKNQVGLGPFLQYTLSLANKG